MNTNGKTCTPAEQFTKYYSVISHSQFGVLQPDFHRGLRHCNLYNGRERRRWRDVLMVNQVVISFGS